MATVLGERVTAALALADRVIVSDTDAPAAFEGVCDDDTIAVRDDDSDNAAGGVALAVAKKDAVLDCDDCSKSYIGVKTAVGKPSPP